MKMKCPRCNSNLRRVLVSIEGAKSKAVSHQCPKCDYFEFEPESSKKVIEELRGVFITMQHKVIKLSKDRLGMYFNKNIIRCCKLKGGEILGVSVPDKKHIVLELKSKI